jgi:hypothetical protein
MNKKGSHVGFVISFVMFITFVIFVYVLLNSRLDLGQNKQNSLEYTKSAIIERVSENLTITSLNVNSQTPENCLYFTGFITKTAIGDKFIAKNDSGNIFTASMPSDKTGLYIIRGGSDSNFFRIYSSDEFPSVVSETLSYCTPLDEGTGYTIGLSKEETDVFESKIQGLLNNYTTDYEALKKDIKIKSGDEFGFIFTYNNGTQVKTPEKNVTINVYSERIPVQYIKTSSIKETGFIDVVVW